MAREVTRRQILAQAGTAAAGVAGLSMAGCSAHSTAANAQASDATVLPDSFVIDGYRKFITRPDLNPPAIKLARKVTGSQAHHIFMNAPYSGPGRGGAMILDPNGNLVWMGPDTPEFHKLDFNTQVYQGEPHLTWWEGHETHGWGQGVAVVADSHYNRKHTIHAVGHGIMIDHHEFNMTPQSTGLVTIYRTLNGVDLRPIGGRSGATMAEGIAQEIDPKTNKLVGLREWRSLDHVPITESHQLPTGFGAENNPYDYFHINSLVVTADGEHLLISSRNCWCVYKVSRKTGKIVWRLGGKKSDFDMGPGTIFHWQHHVRPHPGNLLTVFDNGAAPPKEKQSRALLLHVDEDKMRVRLVHEYTHPGAHVLSSAMGSAQLLEDGRMFVGWGTNPYFSEFSANGELLVAGRMPRGNPSYRMFAADWTGHPEGKPDVAVHHRNGKAVVYVSWNGSTAATSWTILAGKSRSAMSTVGTAHRAGFETAIEVRHKGPFYAVQAHDSKGHVLATSAAVKIS